MTDLLQLHPDSYLTLKTPLKLYLTDKNFTNEQFETVRDTFAEQETPFLITGKLNEHNKTWNHSLLTPTFCFNFKEATDSDKCNFLCTRFNGDERVKKWYNSPYSKMFLIEPAAGVYLIFKGQTYFVKTKMYHEDEACRDSRESTLSSVATGEKKPYEIVDNADWSMDWDEFDELVQKMHSYFLEENYFAPKNTVGRNMRVNVMDPFSNYTEKEHNVEMSKVDFTEGLPYFKREFTTRRFKGSEYAFYSNDERANPEKAMFSEGNKIVVYTKDKVSTALVGVLNEIDDTVSADGVVFRIEFFQQFDDSRIPEDGVLFVFQNDSQWKVRQAVKKRIESNKTPAKFMYKTFADFSVDGYEEPQESLVLFLEELLKDKFPPNQMQMEAIIKGLLTKDALLVLGPPGTGKTTVILSWVKYYLKQGLRVLISSQNNAAVDNVLERLDKSIEIVRLGNENKIQNGCEVFLPNNKILAMQQSCEENTARLKKAIAADKEQINACIKTMRDFVLLAEEYVKLKKLLDDEIININVISEKISVSYAVCQKYLKNIYSLKENRAHKKIFLDVSKRKNPIYRFFIRRHIANVEEKLDKDAHLYASFVDMYRQAGENYNSAVDQLTSKLRKFSESGLLPKFLDLNSKLKKENRRIFFNEGEDIVTVPTLKSELKYLYSPPVFFDDVYKNYLLCNEEIPKLEALACSADKLLFTCNEWAAAALDENSRNDIFEELILQSCQVVGATCIGINSNKKFANVEFGVTIIDESGQIQIHNALVPMSRSPKTLMLGDYKQIPPIANSDVVAACENEEPPISTDLLKMSFFEFLFEKMRRREIDRLIHESASVIANYTDDEEQGSVKKSVLTETEARAKMLAPVLKDYDAKPKKDGEPRVSPYTQEEIRRFIDTVVADRKKIVNLNCQFRMPGHISDVISEWFYEGNYFSSYDMSRFAPVVPKTTKPMVVVKTSNYPTRFEVQPENKMGYQNKYEADTIARIIEAIVMQLPQEEREAYVAEISKKIGIISAYGAQVRLIRETLKKSNALSIENNQVNAMVASLDSFQGQERDLIIYSLTRSSNHKMPRNARVGFLKELRRLNVAFTRSKKQLVIVGDIDYLKECLYVSEGTNPGDIRCTAAQDGVITAAQILECSECKVECEKKFARFFRLLMQHVENPEKQAGDLFESEDLIFELKGQVK